MTGRNKFEEMLERLVNEDREGADALFHEIVVEKSRDIYESLLEDEEEVEETVIESTETEMEAEIVEVEEIEVEEVEEDIEVPFSVIENVPVFPGCEKKQGNVAKKKCRSEKVAKFVNKKFNTELASDLGLPAGRKRIFV